MPLDSSIALGVRQPEYENPLKQYANVLAIQGAQNTNALAQYGLAKAKREDADQNALRASLSGVDISTPEGQAAARNALLRSGKVKEAAEFDKSLLERRKITGEIDAKALETGVKALGLYREQLSNVTDPESAARWVAAQYSDPNLAPIVSRMGPMDQAIAKIPRDPKGFQTWLAQNALGMDKFLEKNAPILSTKDVGGTVEDRTFRPLTGELSSLGTTAKTATPGDLLTDARGQVSNRIAAGNLGVAQGNLSVSRQRLANETNPALQGSLAEAKAGGTERGQTVAKAALDLPNAIAKAEAAVGLIDQLVGDLNVDKNGKLMAPKGKRAPHPGFESVVGATIVPGLRFVEGSDSAGFASLLDQIKGGAFLQAFETLKGGGQITELEGKTATQAITRLNKAQSEAEFVKAARELQGVVRDVAKRAKAKAGPATAPAAGSVLKFDAQGNPL